jgi:hypothetical protein
MYDGNIFYSSYPNFAVLNIYKYFKMVQLVSVRDFLFKELLRNVLLIGMRKVILVKPLQKHSFALK